jgi:hypothetical protein
MARHPFRLSMFLAAAVLAALPALAQPGVTLPPSGENQFSSVTQGIGLVRVTVAYNSPDVHGPTGEDRRGKIWGTLVPYGLSNLGPLGICGDDCPWRGGANENTVFTTTHDVKIQGQPLPTGSYGVHFIPGQDEWTVIFSKTNNAWGSYFYDPKDDALRVATKPEKGPYTEWLTYEFIDRKQDRATVALRWEDLQVPFTISVDNAVDLYVQNLRRELKSQAAFGWQNWNAAARYCLRNKTNLEEAQRWAERAVSVRPLFTTLSTLADLQAANGKPEEAKKTMARALEDSTAGSGELDNYASQFLAKKENEEAMKVFELNAKRHPEDWYTHFGLARGHAALGRKDQARAAAKTALEKAGDPIARRAVEGFLKRLDEEKGAR